MSESKTYVFGNDGVNSNGILSVLAPLLNRQGIDPNAFLALVNNRGNGYGDGGWFVWIIFLYFIMMMRNNGFGDCFGNNGNGSLANLINNDNGRDLLMQAIQGNGAAINQLSTTLNCSVGNVQQAINSVMNAVQEVGNKVGQNFLQVINSLQQGNMQIAQQIASCCCENRLAISEQTNVLQQAINGVVNGQERGFAQMGYNTERQTCDIRDAIRDNTAQVVAGQRAAEMRELQRDINERDRIIAKQDVIINNGQQTAIFGQMINQAVTPLATALSTLQGDLNGIKCKLPETTNVPYSPVVGIPSCLAAQYGLGYGLGLGFNGFSAWG